MKTGSLAVGATLLSSLVGCGAPLDTPARPAAPAALSTADCPDNVPAALKPAPDQRLWQNFTGVGFQIYQCAAGGSGAAWVFQAPQADLLNEGGEVVGSHYAGPTWQALDGSTVVGRKIAAAPSPDPNAIPWLLLIAVSHDGDGRFTDVTTIQRLNTSGGKAPTTGCDPAHIGDVARVPYEAGYFFYHTDPGNGGDVPQC
jgi:uncharacterized protein DUF3455